MLPDFRIMKALGQSRNEQHDRLKVRANSTSEDAYKRIIIGHEIPLLLASMTPAGMPPPMGIKNNKKTSYTVLS